MHDECPHGPGVHLTGDVPRPLSEAGFCPMYFGPPGSIGASRKAISTRIHKCRLVLKRSRMPHKMASELQPALRVELSWGNDSSAVKCCVC